MADKKYSNRDMQEYVTKLMTDSEIKASCQQEKIEQLKKENAELLAEISVLKRKDKASARALTLEERKNKYIQEVTKSRCAIEIDRLSRLAERFSPLFDKLDTEDKKKLETFNSDLKATINTLSNLGEYIEERKPLSDAEKNYISEKKRISLTDAVKSDLDDRFNKLVAEFNIKVGESASRGRGRPRKKDQSILVEVNKAIDDKPDNELTPEEKQEVIEKMNEIFYTVKPVENVETKRRGRKKKTEGVFDFDEALNPSVSLADIMKDING